ncbi:transmembrane protein 53-like [Dendronephthya gigantea]|uniref:transmembrane protein 53-like n=1 Tax=Dendronephthya gigantea TaxID=151771 RepID=UPI00106ACE67|nr:transmembrane protein 53-like [Dendronephthya gigantea]
MKKNTQYIYYQITMAILLRRCLPTNFQATNVWQKYIFLSGLKPLCTSSISNKYASMQLKYGAVMTQPLEDNSLKPLVVILGWNDCKPKHLKKYSDIFEDKGWSTICLPAKSFNTFFRTGTKVKKLGLYIAEVIKDQTEKDQPVFLYSFSNGGIAVYFHLTEALTTPGGQFYNSFNVVGSVFDSCPNKPTIESIERVQISITEQMKNSVLRSIVWYAVRLFLPFLVKTTPLLHRIFDDLGKLPLKSPQLFLYSKGDYLAYCDDIEEHIEDRKAQGVRVFSKCWDDSLHVQHYIKYPEEYLKLLQEFVTMCLKERE